MISYPALIIGSIVMGAGGFLLSATILYFAATWTCKLAWRLWDNLGDIYKLESMRYWFNQMQKDGTHVLRKAHEEAVSDRATTGNATADDGKDK